MKSRLRNLWRVFGVGILSFTVAACTNSPTHRVDWETPNGFVLDNPSILEFETEIIPEFRASPLDEYLALLNPFANWELMDAASQERAFFRHEMRREEFIAVCMHRFGFDYMPNLDAWTFQAVGTFSEWHPQERDWVIQWGYGF
ncbi:MAG: hypothetical protein FWG25_05920, partial [Promicromonosporaceae bacterium]|nr:hypothetical protein [Promicromonosporaceae bacterium]